MPLPLFTESKDEPHYAAGKQAIYVKTYGCSHNMSDSEYMAGQLAAYGYEITEDPDQADLLLINSCTVKGPSQDSFLSMVRGATKPLVVAGCVPQADQRHAALAGLSIVGVQQIDKVVDVVEQTLQGRTVRLLDKAHKPSLDLPKLRRNKFVEIIPINSGCLGACTYCKTKHARGHLNSYTQEAIIGRAKTAIAEGVTELWLTSEDSGAYGLDMGTNIASLLKNLITSLPEHVMVRLGMTNPPYILEHVDAMVEILNHPRVYAFLHIPVQSGSNDVLDAMNREYTVEEFQRVVDHLRDRVPGLSFATDIICGFPTETITDFEKTLNLVKHNQFPVLNISQFYPRPGTPAARMKRIATEEVKRRSTELTHIFKEQRPYAVLLGTIQRVWVTEQTAEYCIGRTKSYVQVLLPHVTLGRAYEVEIIEVGKHFVRGKVLV
jgi:threonylcarbamoyladenosine tRNA methylthiotransferase CDKAL1